MNESSPHQANPPISLSQNQDHFTMPVSLHHGGENSVMNESAADEDSKLTIEQNSQAMLQITPSQLQLDAYLQLLQGFVAQSGQQQAFTTFLLDQKQVLLEQSVAIRQEQLRMIQENQTNQSRNSTVVGNAYEAQDGDAFFNTTRRLEGGGTFSAQGGSMGLIRPRANFTDVGRGSMQNTLVAGFQTQEKPPAQPKAKAAPEKEMNDDRIKRMRAYQQFLRIQENEKNSGGLLEDFGSNMMNILKGPVHTVSRVPHMISQGTNMLTTAIMPHRDKTSSNRNSQKGKSDNEFKQDGTQFLLGQDNKKGNSKDSQQQLQMHSFHHLDSDRMSGSLQVIRDGGNNSNLRNSRASELQIIVDSSRIVQLNEDKRDGENDSLARDTSGREFNLELQNLDSQIKGTETEGVQRLGTEMVLGQCNPTTDKYLSAECLNEDRDKMGAFLLEEFNFSDYLGDLNLRQIQQKKDKSRRWFPLEPDSNFKISWDMVGFFFIIYQAMMIPYRFCFKSKAKGYLLYLESLIDIFFMFDFFLNFVTGYYKKGHVIMKRGIIVRHYLRTWFIVDFVASFPYTWIISDKQKEYWPEEHEVVDDNSGVIDSSLNSSYLGSGQYIYDPYLPFNYQYRMLSTLPPVFTTTSATDFGLPALLRLLKLVRLVRLIKALQIFKLRKFIYRYEWFFFNDFVTVVSDLFKTLVVILFIIHWVSCVFFLIADIEDDNAGQATWLLLLSKTDLNSAINVYIASISFAFTTISTTGYGDIYAVTNVEKCFAMFAMIISCGIFAYIVGFLGALFDRSNQIVGEFQEKIIRINQYLVKVKAPKYFQKQVKRYLIYLMANKNENKMEEAEVFEMLSDNLKQELIIHLNGKMLHQTAPFYHFRLDFLLDITFILRRETFTMDEKLFEEDDQGDHLHYVTKGHVNLTHKRTATYIREISYDTFLGELSFFSGLPRKASAKSKNFTETLTLYLNEFHDAIVQHEEEVEKFERIKQQVLSSLDYSLLGTKCYICGELGHISVDCSQFAMIKGNLKQIALERMQQQALKKQLKEDAKREQKGDKPPRKRNEDSFGSFEGDLNSGSLEDNSIVEMFSYLERRYKKDENMSPKQRRPEEVPKLPPKADNTTSQFDSQEISPIQAKQARITHLAQVIPLTESRNIQNLKNQNFLRPQNIDEIEENSNEESVLSRESILMRQSIDSQLALVNKLTEIQSIGLTQSANFHRANTGERDRLVHHKAQNRLSHAQRDLRGSEVSEEGATLEDYNALQSLEKIRLSRGYLGKSMMAKKDKMLRYSEFEQIDEEDDEEMLIHRSTPHRLPGSEAREEATPPRGAGDRRRVPEMSGIDYENLGSSLIPLQSLNRGVGALGGGLMAQIVQNTQELEELKEERGFKRKDKKYKRNQNLIRPDRARVEKRAGEVPQDFQLSYEQEEEQDQDELDKIKKRGK